MTRSAGRYLFICVVQFCGPNLENIRPQFVITVADIFALSIVP
jgi:hypothetical protein